ncbi:MAG: GTPase HflX [Bacillota bacterium]|nr:GTPase HflX [Bacillota bacterium]
MNLESEATGQAQRAILVAAVTVRRGKAGGEDNLFTPEESLAELARLAETAGLVPVRTVIQQRPAPHAAHFVGSGKAAELSELGRELGCGLLICDDELTGAQLRNLEEATELEVLDRSQLILHIFAGRARSREGKLQVELAQLLYRLPRLTGRGVAMSRLGGGIGTRGPGESKLETDRRTIRTRISELNDEIGELRQHRALHRDSRRRAALAVVALVGYTNAGKSTLLNRLTGSDVLAEDRLFVTLDPTTRSVDLPNGGQALLTDTVGFIHKLPHMLVAAFRATLEEAAEADLLCHVIDASHPRALEQAAVVQRVLESIGAGARPSLAVLSKADLVPDAELPRLAHSFPGAVTVSGATGQGIDHLLTAIEYELRSRREDFVATIPYARADLLSMLHAHGRVESEDYGAAGVTVRATIDRPLAAKIRSELERGGRA